jgi:broad specificity phosphatase PhoE
MQLARKGIKYWRMELQLSEIDWALAPAVGGRSLCATLTTNGAKQAKALGEYLRDYLQLHLDAVYASTLVRAYDTATITCAVRH